MSDFTDARKIFRWITHLYVSDSSRNENWAEEERAAPANLIAAFDSTAPGSPERERHLTIARRALTYVRPLYNYANDLLPYCYKNDRTDYISAIFSEEAIPELTKRFFSHTRFSDDENIPEAIHFKYLLQVAEALAREPEKVRLIAESANTELARFISQGETRALDYWCLASTHGLDRVTYRRQQAAEGRPFEDTHDPRPDWVADGAHVLRHLPPDLVEDNFWAAILKSAAQKPRQYRDREEGLVVSEYGNYDHYPSNSLWSMFLNLKLATGEQSPQLMAALSGIRTGLKEACEAGSTRIVPLFVRQNMVHMKPNEMISVLTPDILDTFARNSVQNDAGAHALSVVDLMTCYDMRTTHQELATELRLACARNGLLFAAPKTDFDYQHHALGVVCDIKLNQILSTVVDEQSGTVAIGFLQAVCPVGVTNLDGYTFVGAKPGVVVNNFLERSVSSYACEKENTRLPALIGLLNVAAIGWPQHSGVIAADLAEISQLAQDFNMQAQLSDPTIRKVMQRYADLNNGARSLKP